MALADMSEMQFDQIVNLNIKGTWWCLKYEIPAMIQSGGGCIVNCSSTAAFKTTKGISVYTATKAALVGMTKGAAVDYAKKGIRINAVCPSLVETAMSSDYQHLAEKAHPMGRLCRPEEVADAVLWLCSDKASFITGEALAIDGGFLSV
jgi:NAD(P)-dependent dehydrogenase (short-subunit alcohol dehydrogenase family)